MKLTTDDGCRIQSRELFKPNTAYDAEVAPDGSVRLIEFVNRDVPVMKPRRVNGSLRWPEGRKPTRAQIAAAVRTDRDSR